MLISIITATYNSASTLRDTFDSILSQTNQNYEYIVIDGASKDGTIDIIKEYEPRFNGKMRWISGKDKGIYDAMNKGIAMATGDVVGILNSDDFYTSNNVLEVINNVFEDNDIDAVYGDVHYVDPNNLKKCVRYYSSKKFRRWKMRFGFMPAHPSFYCKRIIYDKLGMFNIELKIASDFECLLRFIFVNKINIHYLPLDFVTMREGGASSSGFNSHKQILKDHLVAYKNNNVFSNTFFETVRYIDKLCSLANQFFIKIITYLLTKIILLLNRNYHIDIAEGPVSKI
ncbi:MAG: glycosyltransferase [Bacteroidales bacterium]|nr:glycosyltransferase [Bacteroidales bacterium]